MTLRIRDRHDVWPEDGDNSDRGYVEVLGMSPDYGSTPSIWDELSDLDEEEEEEPPGAYRVNLFARRLVEALDLEALSSLHHLFLPLKFRHYFEHWTRGMDGIDALKEELEERGIEVGFEELVWQSEIWRTRLTAA